MSERSAANERGRYELISEGFMKGGVYVPPVGRWVATKGRAK